MRFPELLSDLQKLADRVKALQSDAEWCYQQVTIFKRDLKRALPEAEDYFRGPNVARETELPGQLELEEM